ncbi:hypothetical protein FH972_025159 [Carpinus fangiana]|uniref:Uncharacterized protein n=1 Tax=Carpinus fangiana TaxID=176857 RepID=A0A5N6L0K0_9ROSI|nr:hypothetical protein FH972_025159 [Carpinus fangiana]
MDSSSSLRSSIQASLPDRRPLLHHLNADTSWLLQLPRPDSDPSSRYWYNILIDPWLSGSQSDIASWFSQQWHAQPPATESIAAVEVLCQQVESLTTDLRRSGSSADGTASQGTDSTTSMIDVVTISHEFTDHCHRETLLELRPSVPVFAATKAAALVRGWNHFDTVHETPLFSGDKVDWHETNLEPLPKWLAIARLVEANNALYYHSAVLITFANLYSSGNEGSAEVVVYTPHGIHSEPLQQLTTASPRVKILALLHGLHDIKLSKAQQLNLGAHNGLQAQRLLEAKYWIGTHDEVKKGGGIVSWFLRRKIISVKEALELEGHRGGEEDTKLVDNTAFVDIGNGEVSCLV